MTLAVSDFDYDVLIVGSGMVGSVLAAALGHSGLKVGLIERKSFGSDWKETPQPDGRASALALGSVRLLEQVGAWPLMQSLGVSPIERIRVSDGSFPGQSVLRCEEIGQPALGYIVENQVTLTALHQVLSQCSQVSWLCPAQIAGIEPQPNGIRVSVQQGSKLQTYQVQLVVGADGMNSQVRQLAGIRTVGWEYDQACIVTTVVTEQPHQQTAYERFQPSGPFAILPMTDPLAQGHRSCVVWTIRAADQPHLLSLTDPEFIAAMSPSFGDQLGRIRSVSTRSSYIPRRQHSLRYTTPGLALVGDAAHTTHPVGGQGVNLGMRDAAALSSLLIDAAQQGRFLADPKWLAAYQRSRQFDNRSVLLATDLANRLFSNRWLPLQGIRRLGLIGLDYLPPIKQALMRQAMGIARHHPQLSLATVDPQPDPVLAKIGQI